MIANPSRPKKCKNPACGQTFTPQRMGQHVCSPLCGLAIKDVNKDKAKKAIAHTERLEHREAKKGLKKRSDYMREAQTAWNRYVRARDLGLPCASCGATPSQKLGGTMDCSHYRSVGSAPHLRFHLHNAAAACVRCNRNLSGNIVELRKGMIDRIGSEKIEAVERDQSVKKFTIEYLVRLKKIFSKKARILESRKNNYDHQ